MESIDPANLADVNKSFNKPHEYAAVLKRLADLFLLRLANTIGKALRLPDDRAVVEIRVRGPGEAPAGRQPLREHGAQRLHRSTPVAAAVVGQQEAAGADGGPRVRVQCTSDGSFAGLA